MANIAASGRIKNMIADNAGILTIYICRFLTANNRSI